MKVGLRQVVAIKCRLPSATGVGVDYVARLVRNGSIN